MPTTQNAVVPPGYKLGTQRWGKFLVIVTIDQGLWHLSISHPTRDLTYDEIKKARYRFVPDNVTMAMIFPPKDQFLNYHEHCFQLWEIAGEESDELSAARLREFNRMGAKVRAPQRAIRRDNSDGFQ